MVHDGRVVLIRRARPPLMGEWSIPGGAVEVGEHLEAAVRRELREETGLAVSVGAIVEVLDRISQDGDGRTVYHYVLIDYLCRVESGELLAGSDALDARWAAPADLPSYSLRPETLRVVERGLAMAARGSAPETSC